MGTTISSILRPARKLTEAEEYARSVQLGGRSDTSTTTPPEPIHRPPARRGSGIAHEIAESRRLSSLGPTPDSPKLKRQPSGTLTPTTATANLSSKRRTPDGGNTNSYTSNLTTPQNSNVTIHAPLNPAAYPVELPGLLDGTHHTDELCTRFGTGWPVLEKWLCALGDGEGSGDYGRVVVVYR